MFIGHVATALAAKRIDPRPSLGTYMLAASWADVLFSALLLFDWETVKIAPGHTAMTQMAFPHYPFSHSLAGAVVAAVLIGAIYWAWRRFVGAALVVASLVIGHWILDAISHVPDMPIGFTGPVVGLGLWRSVAATFAVEGLLFFAGVMLYLRATRAKDRIGRWALAGLVGLLAIAYVSGPFAGPPPSAMAMAVVNNIACWLLILWTVWIDRHRTPAAAAQSA